MTALTQRAPPTEPEIVLARYPGGSALIIPTAHPDHGKMVCEIMRGLAGERRERRELPPLEEQMRALVEKHPWMFPKAAKQWGIGQ